MASVDEEYSLVVSVTRGVFFNFVRIPFLRKKMDGFSYPGAGWRLALRKRNPYDSFL